MARARTQYVCQNCGAVSARWQGRCEECEEWNCLIEESAGGPGRPRSPAGSISRGRIIELKPLTGVSEEPPRLQTGIGEFDRATGGGLVAGSALLIGGEPGIGKSTLLLQAAASLAHRGKRAVYISGEESIQQIRLRARRLGLAEAPVELAAETAVDDILNSLDQGTRPDLLVLDSIQTLWTGAVDSAPGTVGQIRAASQAIINFAKRSGTAVCLVGHITKDGQIAGPKTVEHMVDAVLTFEGDSGRQFRIMRASKNRFGPTDEIGVFEMAGSGLREVANPSDLFLTDRHGSAPGTVVFAGIEGTRPVLCEIQALVAPSLLGIPRRAVVGWDSSRLAMVLAVLESRCGVRFGARDVYLNVAGGLRVSETAADLAVAAALVSSLTNRVLPADGVYFGEIGLSGEVRPVAQTPLRLKEAERLGFETATFAETTDEKSATGGIGRNRLRDLSTLVARIAQGPRDTQATIDEETQQLSATAA